MGWCHFSKLGSFGHLKTMLQVLVALQIKSQDSIWWNTVLPFFWAIHCTCNYLTWNKFQFTWQPLCHLGRAGQYLTVMYGWTQSCIHSYTQIYAFIPKIYTWYIYIQIYIFYKGLQTASMKVFCYTGSLRCSPPDTSQRMVKWRIKGQPLFLVYVLFIQTSCSKCGSYGNQCQFCHWLQSNEKLAQNLNLHHLLKVFVY